jgi:MYXO-CTERM domain-containing protein
MATGSTGANPSAHESFGCAASTEETPRAGFELALGGLLGAALLRARARRRR